MANRLPHILSGSKVCVICEGYEEYEYLIKLKSLNLWNEKYTIVLENAEGNGNIPARYQDKYQNGSYDIVLVFCDTDRKPYEQYEDIKRKINELHGVENAAGLVLIFGNPCTMQIILEHWGEVALKSQNKKKNSAIIFNLTGVGSYSGKADQREKLFSQITANNYCDMCKRIKKLSTNDTEVGSSNFGVFIERISDSDAAWIKEINDKLESE